MGPYYAERRQSLGQQIAIDFCTPALTYRIAFVLVASGVRIAVVELLLRVEVEL